ncbi:MAG: hypothetical protein JO114_05080 [Planctomycetaceae bacterium]|nr:hypothetical protein [Planctomycetaceae bacterium]MBV8311136.1 hypothetical protein [Planctomycetaceae bacterium]
MEAHPQVPQPASITGLQRRFESWRRSHRKRSPLPKDLWEGAAALARIHGINPIARALNLDYYDLKRHIASEHQPADAASAAFVEVSMCVPASAPERIVEMERPDGGRMKIWGADQNDLLSLAQSFWRCGA